MKKTHTHDATRQISHSTKIYRYPNTIRMQSIHQNCSIWLSESRHCELSSLKSWTVAKMTMAVYAQQSTQTHPRRLTVESRMGYLLK